VWIALSDRVVAALLRQRDRQRVQRLTAGGAYEDRDLMFTRRDGRPLRPEYVLREVLARDSHDACRPLVVVGGRDGRR
jgi:hypothetical protein